MCKLKTIAEIRRSSARVTFIAEIAYLALNSSLDWEPLASSTILYATKAMGRGSRQARKDRVAAVETNRNMTFYDHQ